MNTLIHCFGRSKLCFDIILEKQQYYFSSHHIKGKLVLISPKVLNVKRIKLKWKGLVRIDLDSQGQDKHTLFKNSQYLDIHQNTDYITLLPHICYEFQFEIIIPNSISLPSFTESEYYLGGAVEYIIEAHLERRGSLLPREKSECRLPLLDRIYVDHNIYPSPIKSSLDNNNEGLPPVVIRVLLSRLSFKRGEAIEVSVPVCYDLTHQQGLVEISLIRHTQVICKQRLYLLPEVLIEQHSIPTNHNAEQVIHSEIKIPFDVSPTIRDNGHLIDVRYHVRASLKLIPHSRNQSPNEWTAEEAITIGTYPLLSDERPRILYEPKSIKGIRCREIGPFQGKFLDKDIISKLYPTLSVTTISHSRFHNMHQLYKRNKTSKSLFNDDFYSDDESIIDADSSLLSTAARSSSMRTI